MHWLDLTLSNPTAAGLPYEEERILRALAQPGALRYQPHPRGLPAAREAVAEYYGGLVDPARIVLTASTSEAYSLLFKLLEKPLEDLSLTGVLGDQVPEMAHIRLADAVDTSEALLDSIGIPREVVVHH